MTEQTIPLGDLSGLEIKSVQGDLTLTGWNREEIRIREGEEENAQVEQKKGQLLLSSSSDLIVHFPHNLPIKIKSINGDASLRSISSDLNLESVSGDLSLRGVGSVSFKSLGGDLMASRIQGVLRGESIGGNCLVSDVQGQVELKHIGGDAQLETVDGGIDIQAAGDGLIEFHPVSWQAYRIQVGGDLAVNLPADSDADLSIQSGEEDIRVLPGKLDVKVKQKKYEQRLGEGGTPIQLIAGGDVFIADDEFTIFTGLKMNLEDLESIAVDFSEDTAEQIKINLGNLEEDLQESLSGLEATLAEIGLSEESLQDLGEQIKESSRRAAEKAEIAAIKAQAKVEKKIAKARRRALKAREKTKQFDLNEFLEARAEKDSVTEKERTLILKMLQEKKISPEEADQLLKALEGK